MKARLWGTRGSLPSPLNADDVKNKIATALVQAGGRHFADRDAALQWMSSALPFEVAGAFGGNTSCVQIETGNDEYLLCDAGSGIRVFGNRVLAERAGKPGVYHLLMSHLHWDHIMGFPFFTPAYIPGNTLRIYGCHTNIEAAFRRQHGAPSFPVNFDSLGADIEFITLEAGRTTTIAGVEVTPKLQLHEGDSYGYRLEQAGKSIVYSTDSEHKPEDIQQTNEFVEFFRNADIVIFDAMYSFAEAVSVKEDWGHGSNVSGVEICQMADVKHLVLFHHEPVHDDARIAATLSETRRLEQLTREQRHKMRVTSAYDGLELQA